MELRNCVWATELGTCYRCSEYEHNNRDTVGNGDFYTVRVKCL
jgi:hypothetical protein